jgi:hypothetical protein
MTLSEPETTSRTWVQKLDALEDGTILRVAFFAMLAGTAWMLFSDYQALSSQAAHTRTGHEGNPVLPAVERPEIDPANPAYRPLETITTPRDVLSAPLEIELLSGGVLKLTGTISLGSSVAFAQEVEARGGYIETIRLNSPGGSVEDALAIAALVREKGYATVVEDGALCASSCPLILASGSTREVAPKGSVGVHQIYAGAEDAQRIGPAQAMSDAQIVTARIARHFETMGVSPSLWLHALETPPDRLYYLTREQMLDYGLIGQADG